METKMNKNINDISKNNDNGSGISMNSGSSDSSAFDFSKMCENYTCKLKNLKNFYKNNAEKCFKKIILEQNEKVENAQDKQMEELSEAYDLVQAGMNCIASVSNASDELQQDYNTIMERFESSINSYQEKMKESFEDIRKILQ
ncbi:uncharacterized protein LOC129619346 [Condylostylus longicornis]|uniref:uncharacterized protein LOC129619346 n=1 Tax=Condylostylus longicornis TaxID=2530218 RepID=UPI00244E2D4B|nr:uncharacterized protein LOC129619346 [Condylostylus longicornis]